VSRCFTLGPFGWAGLPPAIVETIFDFAPDRRYSIAELIFILANMPVRNVVDMSRKALAIMKH